MSFNPFALFQIRPTANLTGITADGPIGMMQTTDFDTGGDFTVTSTTVLTVDRTATYLMTLAARAFRTVGATARDIGAQVLVNSVIVTEVSATLASGSNNQLGSSQSFLIGLTAADTITVDFANLGGETWTVDTAQKLSFMRLNIV